MQSKNVFHRNELAEKIAKRVLLPTPGSASSSGLFLSAPRRTGKSTFIREDLRPVLLAAGTIVIYIDLWADKKADPGRVIISAIKSELAKYEGVIKRLAKSAGMDKVNVGGMSFSIDRVGLDQDISLSGALAALSDEIEKPIVLIIDEAQHAITTNDGSDTLFSLKAARDELNSSLHHGLHIIATGSNQAKLAMLRSSKDQAFFGAHLLNFPPLGQPYIDWFCHNLEFGNHLDPLEVMALFKKSAFRPEILAAAAEALRDDFELKDEDVAKRFSEEVLVQIESSNNELLRVIQGLTPIQFAVLKVLAESGEEYVPYVAETLVRYKYVLEEIKAGADVKTDVTSVQQALIALQEKFLVWKASRGVYSVEDTAITELFDAGLFSKRPRI